MQVLIEISKEEYKAIKFMVDFADKLPDDDCAAPDAIDQALEAIGRGTPLPKGHGRLKDADMLIAELKERHDFFVNAYGGFNNILIQDKARVDEIDANIAMVINAPTIIEADNAEQEAATR